MDNNIVLIGMPGCGKTTIGNILSEKINYKFIDMDNFIEEKEGKTVKDIFKISEEYFRTLETDACKVLSNGKSTVIACGGGVIKNSINIELLKNSSTIIFIDRPVENILADIEVEQRPLLLNGKEVLYKLYDERYELYNLYCDYKVENKGSLEEVLNKINKILK